MSATDVRLSVAAIEGMHLAGLVIEFTALITVADEAPDAGIERLTPTPYPDDADASAEFRTATRDDLLDRRTADAAVVSRALEPLLERAGSEVDGSVESIELVIPFKELDSWLRTLTALRLAIAPRLGIVGDHDAHDPDDPRFGVFDWLGYRLDRLISIADEIEMTGD